VLYFAARSTPQEIRRIMEYFPPLGGGALNPITRAVGSAESLLGLALVLVPLLLITSEYLMATPNQTTHFGLASSIGYPSLSQRRSST
jgi:hypothetical protein